MNTIIAFVIYLACRYFYNSNSVVHLFLLLLYF